MPNSLHHDTLDTLQEDLKYQPIIGIWSSPSQHDLATLSQEIHYIWRRPFSFVRAVYIFSKYFGLIAQRSVLLRHAGRRLRNDDVTPFMTWQNKHLWLVLSPFSTPGVQRSVCQRWFAFQLVSSLGYLALLDLILMLRLYALYRKDVRIAIFLAVCFSGLLIIELVFAPSAMYSVPYDPICNALESPTSFAFFGGAVWVVHLSMAALTAAKWNLTVMGIPIAKMVARDRAWSLSLIVVVFAVIVPYSATLKSIKPETVFMWPTSLFSITCCRLIMNMQTLGDGSGGDEERSTRDFTSAIEMLDVGAANIHSNPL
ncbi:hypothetical protein D9613_008913 [Agrocybe pediades]|uniref:DUF6533 domain-containing protein n=1 Tax=Agrocybe pediades TaxID=84607 RepID=A0A8H4QU26_9AGAR|nr:hypothetical protein D9613_008913 [Agrocybe pediades]